MEIIWSWMELIIILKKGKKSLLSVRPFRKKYFLRCLNLLEKPTDGEIWFEGTLISDPKCPIDRVRQKMGMVFQHFNLFPHLTIMDNITLAPIKLKLQSKEEAAENALRLLKRIGLQDKADSYPSMLSGGQKQRIAIVRALARIRMLCCLMSQPLHWILKWSVRYWLL